MDRQVISSQVPVSVVYAIDSLAGRMGLTRSQVIARALSYGIKDLTKTADLASDPVVNKVLRVVAALSEEEERKEVLRVLERLKTGAGALLPGMDREMAL